jgi:autotransporter-associated beta strand protein
VLPTNTTVIVNGGGTLDVNGLSQSIAELTGAGSVILGDDVAAGGMFAVGNAGNFEFDGSISDAGSNSVTKIGTGTLILGGANAYRGITTVSNGTLLVNGSIGGTNTIVEAGATLGGAGVVGGLLTIQSGGTVSPGPASGAIGALTLSNTPALNGVTLMKINRNGGSPVNDRIQLPSGALAYSGTLSLTNVGAPLQAGDAFQLFHAASYLGSFAVTNLPPLAAGLAWSNTLAVNGSVAVFLTVSLVPTNLLWSVSGTNLLLSWPADHTGWRLLIQTNRQANGLSPNSNDWATVANSAVTNSLSLPLNPSLPTEFYRLVYP